MKANGLNRRPSWASSVKTGMKAIAITRSEAKIEGPTSFAESIRIFVRSPILPARSHSSSRRWALSTITIAASTMSPIATMIPPIDMMFMPRPKYQIGMNEMSTATGRLTIGTSADRRCRRNPMIRTLTTDSSSIRLSLAVATDSRIRSLRSYTGMTLTPFGSAGSISFSLALIRSMTVSAFSPKRMTTIPPTTSPSPFKSARPRRMSGPNRTVATSRKRMGVPAALTPTAIFSTSATDLM